jgi:hypothetical protein
LIPFLFSNDQGLEGGDGPRNSALFQLDALPFAANDQIANLGCGLPFYVQLFDKEPFLEAERSGCAMIGGEGKYFVIDVSPSAMIEVRF